MGSYGYLHLCGMQIAATRALIMTAIFIMAIIAGRTPYHFTFNGTCLYPIC